ncbi:MAG: serine protease Do [Saprospiraceae bacterium]|jgi:serine protease Do
MNIKTIFTSLITSIAIIVIFGYFLKHQSNNQPIKEQTPVHQVSNFNDKRTNQVDFIDAASNSVNAVVHIKTKSTKSGGYYYNPINDYFFGNPYQKGPDKIISGSGSGVIISADGYIATNYHVIKGATVIEVTMNDKRIFEATVIGKDPNTDLALLKIKESDLPSIAYANSDNLQVGEWVLAVGNPFNLTSTVTAGIVSAKGRNINLLKEQYAIESFIQTDAAVNPGNSGGALVNTKGELVGINTAIASNTGSYTGYSFAIPVNVVKKVMNDLRNFGSVQRALLGIQIQDINRELSTKMNLNTLNGIYISKVFANSAAAIANLQSGDVITHINGKKTNAINELQEQMSQFGPGDKIDVVYLRNSKVNSVTVKLKGMVKN